MMSNNMEPILLTPSQARDHRGLLDPSWDSSKEILKFFPKLLNVPLIRLIINSGDFKIIAFFEGTADCRADFHALYLEKTHSCGSPYDAAMSALSELKPIYCVVDLSHTNKSSLLDNWRSPSFSKISFKIFVLVNDTKLSNEQTMEITFSSNDASVKISRDDLCSDKRNKAFLHDGLKFLFLGFVIGFFCLSSISSILTKSWPSMVIFLVMILFSFAFFVVYSFELTFDAHFLFINKTSRLKNTALLLLAFNVGMLLANVCFITFPFFNSGDHELLYLISLFAFYLIVCLTVVLYTLVPSPMVKIRARLYDLFSFEDSMNNLNK